MPAFNSESWAMVRSYPEAPSGVKRIVLYVHDSIRNPYLSVTILRRGARTSCI